MSTFTPKPLPFPPHNNTWAGITLDQLHQDLAVAQQNLVDFAATLKPGDAIGLHSPPTVLDTYAVIGAKANMADELHYTLTGIRTATRELSK